MQLRAISVGTRTITNHFDGRVHSVFRRACNLHIDEHTMLTLLSSDMSNTPGGIRLQTPRKFTFLDYLQAGQTVGNRANILRVSGSSLSVDLRRAELWYIDLSKLCIKLNKPAPLRAWKISWTELGSRRNLSGITAMFNDISVSRLSPSTALLAHRARLHISTLLRATVRLRNDQAADVLAKVIGLGPGLTPSGDDFIVGYLSGLWSTTNNEPARLHFLSSLKANVSSVLNKTNRISRECIQHALEGSVSQPIATLAQEIGDGGAWSRLRKAFDNVIQIGHTSGGDAMLGLLLGLIVWQPFSRCLDWSMSWPPNIDRMLSLQEHRRTHA